VFGAVTVIDCGDMVKVTLLTSKVDKFVTSLTFTKHWVDGVLGTIQVYVFVFGAEPLIKLHVAPLSVEYSIFTFGPLKTLLVHVIERVSPTTQFSAVFGDVTVIDCGDMVKVTLLTSNVVSSDASLTFTKH
jgi:hypothetical protein